MKGFKYLFFISMVFVNIQCNAQTNSLDKQAAFMLKEFYTAYSKIWAIQPVPGPAKLYVIIDSLQRIYCSGRLRKEAKEWFFDGHDLLTNDWGIDAGSIKTITVVKDKAKEKIYIVSYIVDTFPQSPDRPVKKRVYLTVKLVQGNGSYKIDAVT